MAVVALEGWDNYAIPADMQLRVGALQWTMSYQFLGATAATDTSTGLPALITPGRGGFGKAMSIPLFLRKFDFIGGLNANFSVNYTTAFFGFAMQFQNCINLAYFTVTLWDPVAAAAQCTIAFYDTGMIRVFSGLGIDGTLLATSVNNAFNPIISNFVEIHPVIGSSGSIAVQINGQQVFGTTGATGIRTQATANAWFGGLIFWAALGATEYINATGAIQIDDFRLNDTTTGPGLYPCNSWMGDLRVAQCLPMGNAAAGWTPLAGANWQEVSEAGFDGDASYNSTTTAGAEDLFNLAGLAATINEVIAVQLTGAYRQADASPHGVSQQIKIGGTDHAQPTRALGLSYQFVTDVLPINPTSGASWTLTDVNTMQIGCTAQT